MREKKTSAAAARILVADDHALVRDGIRAILTSDPGLEVVGEASDGREAVELCRELSPDVVLMDLRMPKMDGLEATRAIKRDSPLTVVLILTASEDPNYLSEALKAGASGYVLKEATGRQVIDAIRKVLEGESPLNQEVAVRLLLQLIDEEPKATDVAVPDSEAPPEGSPGPPLRHPLTQREVEVLRLLARGQTNQQISKNLFVSASTVKKHVRQITWKLGVSDRVQAAVAAIELGLLPEREGG